MSDRNFISRASVLNSNLPSGEKLLLVVLRAFQDPVTGKCSPSKQALCQVCGIVMNTVKKHREALRRKGFITWKSEKTTCQYQFLPKSVDSTPQGESKYGVGYDENLAAPLNDPPTSLPY